MAGSTRGESVRAGDAPVVASARPQGAVLRELLADRHGWTDDPGEARRLLVRRRSYRLTPLARGPGLKAILVEPIGHGGLPDYAGRRELHRRAEVSGGTPLLVFTDAAATRLVWAWRRGAGFGPGIYTEEHRSVDPATERPEVVLPEREAGVEGEGAAEFLQGAEATRRALIARLRRSPLLARRLGKPGRLSAMERLQRLVEGSFTPEIPRRVWRDLGRFRVLDPCCETGAWLRGSLEALVAVATACLQRMQGWVEDASRATPPARADLYSDFRILLARSRELARAGRRDRFEVEMVLLRCLHGVAAHPAAAERCRGELARRLSREGEIDAIIAAGAFVDIRTGTLAEPVQTDLGPSAGPRRKEESAGSEPRLLTEAEALSRAEEQLVRMRLRWGCAVEDLAEGKREIGRRREALARRMAATEDAGGAPPALHARVEYEGVIRAGGFDLIRRPLSRAVAD